MSEDIDIENINGICRLCLKEDRTIIPIFGRENVNRDRIPLSRKILACVSVEVLDKDSLPKMICVGCVHQIDSWYGFKSVCDKSQQRLNLWLDKQYAKGSVASSPDVTMCIDISPEIVLLDSEEEMDMDTDEQKVQDNTEHHKEQSSDDPVNISDDEITALEENFENCEVPRNENTSEFVETDNLQISGTCSLSDKDLSESGDILILEDADASQANTNNNCKKANVEGNVTCSEENNEVQINNSDLTCDNHSNTNDSEWNTTCNEINNKNVTKIFQEVKVRTNLSEERDDEQEDIEFSEMEIIGYVLKSVIRNVEREIDGDRILENNSNELQDKNLTLDKESNPDPDSTCNNTKFVIQAVTSLAKPEVSTSNSVHSNTEVDTEKNKSPDSSWQDVNQDNSRSSKQSELVDSDEVVINFINLSNNETDTYITGFHIKEEPISEDENGEVMVEDDPMSFSSLNIKKEPVESTDSILDVKPNILKLNAGIDLARYNPEIRKNGKVYCEPCRSTFPNHHKYVRHSESNRHRLNMELFNTGEDPIVAKKKNKFFGISSPYKLRKPILYPRNSNLFQCSYCPSSFTLKRNFLHHIKLKHYESYVSGAPVSNIDDADVDLYHFTCSKCDNKFPSHKSLKLHTALKHQDQENICSQCGQKFSQRNALLSHMRYCGWNANRHTCVNCSGMFSNTAAFVAHKQNCGIPGSGQKRQEKQLLACTLCPQCFDTTDNLIKHVRSYHSVQSNASEQTSVSDNKLKSVLENKPKPVYENKARPVSESKSTDQNSQQTFSEDGILYCKYCTRTFSNHGALSSHLGYHTRKESFECKLCPMITKTMKAFKQHMRKHLAEGTDSYICWICYTPFTSPEKLRKHKTVHIKLKIFTCNRCNNSYNSLIALTKHKKKIHGVSDLPEEEEEDQLPQEQNPSGEIFEDTVVDDLNDLPECKICKKKFSTIGNLKRHSLLHVKVKKPIYPPTSAMFSAAGHYRCTNCAKMCGSLAGLRTHFKYCILRGKNISISLKPSSLKPKQSVRCDKCKQYFASKACLYKHRYLKRCPLVDRTKTAAFSCMNCRKLFTTLASLQRHLVNCGDGPERETTCQFCGLKFSSLIVLSGHMQHCGQKVPNNICAICNKRFDGIDELRIHAQTCAAPETNSLNLKICTCSVCSKEFKYSKSLESHIFKNHPEVLLDCRNCSTKFVSQTDLNEHKLVCTVNQTPIVIEVPTMNVNQNTYDGQISQSLCYKCTTCNNVFNSLDDLEIHGISCGTACESDSSKDEVKVRVGYNCRTCGKRFTSRSSLYRHKIAKHSEVKSQTQMEIPQQQTPEDLAAQQPPYVCKLCPGISFHKQKGFLEHMQWHNDEQKFKKETPKKSHVESQPMLTCELCDEQFANESLYQDHMEAHLTNDVEALQETPTSSKQVPDLVYCDLCSKGFDNKQSLKSHRACHFRMKYSPVGSPLKEAGGSSFKKYKVKHVRCNVCDKLLSKNSIAKHKLIHKREFNNKPIPMSSFYSQEQSFVNSPTADDISSQVSLSESQTVFPCTICNKLFRLRKSLHEHMKIHEEENEYESLTRGEDFDDSASTSSFYECKYCDLTWKHKSNYIRHLSTRRHIELQEQLAGII